MSKMILNSFPLIFQDMKAKVDFVIHCIRKRLTSVLFFKISDITLFPSFFHQNFIINNNFKRQVCQYAYFLLVKMDKKDTFS